MLTNKQTARDYVEAMAARKGQQDGALSEFDSLVHSMDENYDFSQFIMMANQILMFRGCY